MPFSAADRDGVQDKASEPKKQKLRMVELDRRFFRNGIKAFEK